MLKSLPKFSATCRCASIVLSSLFLLFQVATQPHRVHHFFEAPSHAHSHTIVADTDSNYDHNRNIPTQGPCVIQSAAKNSHIGQVQLVQIVSMELKFGTIGSALTQRIQDYSFSPFLRRAPPSEAFFS
jgi:hypothetical protein